MAKIKDLVELSAARVKEVHDSIRTNDREIEVWTARAQMAEAKGNEGLKLNALQRVSQYSDSIAGLSEPLEQLERRNLVLQEVLSELTHVRLRLEILCLLIVSMQPLKTTFSSEFKMIVNEIAAQVIKQISSKSSSNSEETVKTPAIQKIPALELKVHQSFRDSAPKVPSASLKSLHEKLSAKKDELALEQMRHWELAVKWEDLAIVAVESGDELKIEQSGKIRDGYKSQASSTDEGYALLCLSLEFLEKHLGSNA